MPVDVAVVAGTVIGKLLVPYLKMGADKLLAEIREEKLAEDMGEDVAEAAAHHAVGVAQRAWEKVRSAFKSDRDEVILDNFEAHPDASEELMITLLKEKMEQDRALTESLSELVKRKGSGDVGDAVSIIADTVGYVDARDAKISGGIVSGYIGSVSDGEAVARVPRPGFDEPTPPVDPDAQV